MVVAVYSLCQTRVGDNIAVGRTVGELVSIGVGVTVGVGDEIGEGISATGVIGVGVDKRAITRDGVGCTVAAGGIGTWEAEYDSQRRTAISARSKPPLSLIDILSSPEHPDF